MLKDLYNTNHKREFRDMNTDEKILWLTDQYDKPQFNTTTEDALEKLKRKIEQNKTIIEKPTISISQRRYWYMAAAVAAIIITIWSVFIYQPVENVIAEKGHHTDYRLPDGTMISLNADSKIEFNHKRFNKRREVKLDGEAFFNVEKGSTFTINTQMADIKILGTSFNVYARDETFKVACFTGKIQILSGSQSIIIKPREIAYLENNELKVIKDTDITATAQWRAGEFNFEGAPIKLVFDEIERQFNVTFVSSGLTDRNFTGTFTNKNLVDALDIICIPMGLTYEIGSNSKIYIKYKDQ